MSRSSEWPGISIDSKIPHAEEANARHDNHTSRVIFISFPLGGDAGHSLREALSRGELVVAFSGSELTHAITLTDASTDDGCDLPGRLYIHLVFPRPAPQALPVDDGLIIGREHGSVAAVDAVALSRRHVSFENRAGLYYCTDLDSRNGTFVNGRRVTEAPIAPGDVMRCGDTVWLVRAGAAEPHQFVELAPDLFGSDTMARALAPLRELAASTVSVILEGETGVGKELAARALHGWSGRTGSYVAVNCAALPDPLCEGELFGYRKGSFTGADRSHRGYFRAAHEGTLLLDEICELTPRIQAKLLRVLDQHEVIPLGESQPQTMDVRVVAAAQRSLQDEARAGRFRADLLTRLGVAVKLPSLRERREDTVPLFFRFIETALHRKPQLHARFVEALLIYEFSRNVRELRCLANSLAARHPNAQTLHRSHLPDWVLSRSAQLGDDVSVSAVRPIGQSYVAELERPIHAAKGRTLSQRDLPRLLAALQRQRGNVVRAATEIGLSRHQAYRLLRSSSGVSLDEFRRDAPRSPSKAERVK